MKLHFWQLSKDFRFWLKKEFWEELYRYKKENKLKWKLISKKLRINVGTFGNYISQYTESKRADFLPKKVLIRITDLLNLSYDEVEKMIVKMKHGPTGMPVEIKFPIDFLTPEWSGFVGGMLAEGYLHLQYVGFWNTKKEIIEKFVGLSRKIFKTKVRIDEKNFGCFFPACIGHILIEGLELKFGNKTKENIRIPKIYKNCKNDEMKKSLLSWLFTGDGWVTLFRDHLGQVGRAVGIGFGSSERDRVPLLLKDTMEMLDSYEILYTKPFREKGRIKSGKITYKWKIFIRGKQNLIRFKEKIGFQSTKKQRILEKCIESYIRPKLNDNQSLELVVKAINNLTFLGIEANKHNISKSINLREKWVERLLKRARDRKLVTVIGGGNRLNGRYGGKSPYIYQVVRKVYL